MAGSVKGITVEIGGDTTKLGKALQSSEKQSKNLQKELKQVNTALKFNPSNVELLTQKQKILTDQIQATKEKLDTLRAAEAQVTAQFKAGEIGEDQFRAFQREIVETESKLRTYQSQLEETGKKASALDTLTETISDQEQAVEELKNEYKNAVLEYGKNSDEAKALAKQIDELSGELKDNKETMSELDKAADDLDNSLEEVDNSAERAKEGFTVMKGVLADLASQAIQKVVSGLTDLAKKTLEVGMSFESSMSNNAALFKASDEELQKLTETAQHYGETTQFSASEAADALGYMALAGWDVNKATSELGGVLDLAAASGMGLAEASDMVTDYLSAFSNTTMTAAQFADKLAYAQANSNTTAQQLGEAYKNSAANLNAAGQDVETVTSLLAAMANQGLKGSEAGTALSAMMRDLTAKMKDGAVKIGDTTVAVMDAEGNYRDLTDILKDVEAATKGMGDAEKAAALSSTFTADSIKGLNLILNDGVDKAADFENGLRDCDGAAGEMANTMNDNVAGSLKLLQSNIESKMIKVFEAAKGSIKGSVESMSSALDSLDWDKIGEAVGRFAGKIADLFNYLVNNSDTVIATLKTIGTIIATVFAVNKLAGFISSIGTLSSAFTGLWGVLAANPIGAVALAVAGLTAGVLALNKAHDKQLENTYGLNEEEQKLINKINEEKSAIEQATKARQEANKAIEAESGYNSQLWDELQSIVDENGKIKEGYEDRAAVITGLLSEALGVEIEIVDGQIQKYGELKGTIEDVIRTKRAEALLEANKADYTNAIKNESAAYLTYKKAVKEAEATQRELTKAQERADEIRSQITDGTPKTAEVMAELNSQYLDSLKTVDILTGKYNDQNKAVSDAEKNYYDYVSVIRNYEGVMAAMANGDVQQLSDALDRLSNNFLTSKTASKEMLEAQLTDFKDQYAAMKEAVDAGMPGVTQAQVEAMGKLVKDAEAELNKLSPAAETAGKKAGQKHADGIKETAKANKTAGAKLVTDAATGMASKDTKAVGKKKGNEYASGVSSAADSGKKAGETVAKKTDSGLGTADANKTGKNKGSQYVSGVQSAAGSANTAGKNVANQANSGLNVPDTLKTGKTKGTQFATGLNGTASNASTAGKNLANKANSGAGSVSLSGSGSKLGGQFASGVNSKQSAASTSGKNLANKAKSGAGSVSASSSGSNFGQGFVNGIASKFSSAFEKAKGLAKQALAGLRKGQQESSPSKLTYKSGEYFDEGYINAIQDKTKDAVKAAQNLAKKTVAGLGTVDVSDAINAGDIGFNAATFNRQLENTFTGSVTPDFSVILDKLDAVMNTITQNSGRAIVLDTGALVGATVNQYDAALADVYGLKARGI